MRVITITALLEMNADSQQVAIPIAITRVAGFLPNFFSSRYAIRLPIGVYSQPKATIIIPNIIMKGEPAMEVFRTS